MDNASTGRGGRALLVPFSTLVLILPLALFAYKDGPPPATTGGFGESDCTECHFGRPLNAPGYTLRLLTLPERYEPGKRYTLTLLLDPEPPVGGFELSVRFADGPKKGMQAGKLQPVKGLFEVILSNPSPASDPASQPSTESGTQIQYARHSRIHPGIARWAFGWTAPDPAEGAVVFHVAANAANGDDSPLGDFVYTLEKTLDPEK